MYVPKNGNSPLKSCVLFRVKRKKKSDTIYLTLAKDVVDSFCDISNEKVKIFLDDEDRRKILLIPTKKEDPKSVSLISHKNSKCKRVVLTSIDHTPSVDKGICSFVKYNYHGDKGLLITFPE